MSSQPPSKLPLAAIASLLGQQRNALENQQLSPLLEALLKGANPPQPNALGSLFSTQTPTPPSPQGLFGLISPPRAGIGSNSLRSSGTPRANGYAGVIPPKPRNVFYSFHYQDVFRVNHIRKSGQFRTGDKVRDRSLWEKAKRTDAESLKRVIKIGLGGTSVTCVLAGYETWSREWVRYEIAWSLMRGNALLTVFIDGCECPREGFSARGYNPLDGMALGSDNRIYEHRANEWVLYDKVTGKVPGWPKWLPRPPAGCVMPLSEGATAYDWVAEEGHRNLIRWANRAAIAAGK